MKAVYDFWRAHIAWRPQYYHRLWKARRYLENYREVLHNAPSKDPGAFRFRSGPTWHLSDPTTGLQVFDEVFVGEHYRFQNRGTARTVVDIGANIGLFSLYAHLKLPAATIYAIEADPSTFATLAGNVEHNALQDFVRPFHLAISSVTGTLTFYRAATSGWSSLFPVRGAEGGEAVQVSSMSLPAFCAAQGIGEIDILKIDVEGAEYDIVLGDPGFFEVPVHELLLEVDRDPRDSRYGYAALMDRLRQRYHSVVTDRPGDEEYPLVHCHGLRG
jgi:FkbM family methyltransferase